jgi:ribosome-associated toxin RatA of RatAB toxin-antitoxin module
MATAQTTDVFNCTPEQFFKIVSDYPHYPEFLQEVKECKILKTEGDRKLIEYTVSVMKTFKYTLWMTEQAPETDSGSGQVTWEFASGDLFKTSSGSWKIQGEGGKTRATYTVDATFTMFVPGPIAKALVSVNLPNMVASYHKRVASLYGR